MITIRVHSSIGSLPRRAQLAPKVLVFGNSHVQRIPQQLLLHSHQCQAKLMPLWLVGQPPLRAISLPFHHLFPKSSDRPPPVLQSIRSQSLWSLCQSNRRTQSRWRSISYQSSPSQTATTQRVHHTERPDSAFPCRLRQSRAVALNRHSILKCPFRDLQPLLLLRVQTIPSSHLCSLLVSLKKCSLRMRHCLRRPSMTIQPSRLSKSWNQSLRRNQRSGRSVIPFVL